jgi:hypothetical protein
MYKKSRKADLEADYQKYIRQMREKKIADERKREKETGGEDSSQTKKMVLKLKSGQSIKDPEFIKSRTKSIGTYNPKQGGKIRYY